MPAPFSPDPADPDPGRSPDPTPHPSTRSATNHDPDAPTPLAGPTPPVTEPPTVISAARPKLKGVDPHLGEYLAGRKLGHFELIEPIGSGGMAAVVKARDLDLGRVVAVKILPPDLAADPENIVRFKQEARAAARLDHENVARVYFIGEDQGLHFIAFEFVEGDNLRQLMEANGGAIPVPDAVALMLQVAAGLAHAAERGVVHRDIKPSNIIVTPDGRAKIVDMGLARNLDPKAVGQLTESGVTLGTFDYISPEQAIEPRLADVRSDIYSLGCTFYHALTGHPPVPDGTAARKLDAQRNLLAPDPRGYNPDIPAELAAVLGRMMAKDPDRRYQHPDHLAAHLRGVAKKLGVPTGPAPAAGPQTEDPIPPAPRLSAAWAVTAVAVLALALAVFTNAFHARPPAALWPDDLNSSPGPDTSPAPAGPPAAAVTGQREAANTAELVSFIRQGVKQIKLTGSEPYDLFAFRDVDGQPTEVVLSGDDVELVGGGNQTIKLAYAPTDSKARLNSFTIRGTGKGKASIQGVRFSLPEREVGGADDAGLLVTGFEQVKIEGCTFTPKVKAGQRGPAALALSVRGGTAAVTKCYFAPGCVGVAVDGPGRVALSDCALALQHAGVRVTRSAAEPAGETHLVLTHCSALLSGDGAAVEVGDGVPCLVRAGLCLFAGPDRFGPDDVPVVLRQLKNRAPATRFVRDDGESGGPNAYPNLAAYADTEGVSSFADAARDNLPVHDAGPAIKHPWTDPDPFTRLAAEPKRSFTQNLRMKELRGDREPNRDILGARFLGPEPLYGLPLPSPDAEPRDATVKVWDPSLKGEDADKPPPGVFPTLAQAVAAVRRGDTLLIRHTGWLDVEPCEFTRADTLLTIKPEPGSKPVLVPAASALKRPTGLFKLYGGKLVLDGLHFWLPADRAPAVAVLPGGGQLDFRNGVVTLEDGEGPAVLSAVTLTDPRGEMMMGTSPPDRWPVPRVTFENMFLRGKGRLVAVKGSRPFELDVKNALAVLDSTLMDVEPSTADPSAAGSGVVRLSHLTAYLGGSLLHVRAADRKGEMGPGGLTRTEVTAANCAFLPATGDPAPFVRADRFDTREQAERWLTWRGKDNVYGYDKKKVMLELRPSNVEAMPALVIEGDRWLEMTLEPPDLDPFVRVGYEYELPAAGNTNRFLGVRPIEFEKPRFTPGRPDGSAEVGAPTTVPAPFPGEERPG